MFSLLRQRARNEAAAAAPAPVLAPAAPAAAAQQALPTPSVALQQRVEELEAKHTKTEEHLEKLERCQEQLEALVDELIDPERVPNLPPATEQNVKEWCAAATPSKDELDKMRRVEAEFVEALGSWSVRAGHSYTYERVKVVPAGSTQKGTSVKGRFDLDVVVFIPEFNPSKMDEYQREAHKRLQGRPSRVERVRNTPAGSSFKYEDVKVDVLFTGEQRGSDPISYKSEATRLYMASLTQKQIDFVKRHTGDVERDVIRGFKKWIKDSSWDSLRAPSSYLIEVLVIHTAMQPWGSPNAKLDGKPLPVTDSNRLGLFRRVCNSLADLHNAKINVANDAIPHGIEAPYILDPVNPHNNLLDGLKPRALAHIFQAAKLKHTNN